MCKHLTKVEESESFEKKFLFVKPVCYCSDPSLLVKSRNIIFHIIVPGKRVVSEDYSADQSFHKIIGGQIQLLYALKTQIF